MLKASRVGALAHCVCMSLVPNLQKSTSNMSLPIALEIMKASARPSGTSGNTPGASARPQGAFQCKCPRFPGGINGLPRAPAVCPKVGHLGG